MRTVSILIPYYIVDGNLYVLMQQRSLEAKSIPGYLSFFGGGVEENETPEQGLIREIKEELDFTLNLGEVTLFQKYEFYKSVNYFYLFKVSPGWQPPAVLEGDSAEWMDVQEAFSHVKILFKDKTVLNDLERELLQKPIR